MDELDAHLTEAARTFGTPSYVYLTDAIDQRLAEIRAALGPWFALSYAMKCNPNPGLLNWLADRVDFLDVSSIGELRLARQAGWDPARASFTGPGKRDTEIAEAIESGIGELIVENLREAIVANRIAGDAGRAQDVLIRLAPSHVPKGFGDHMAGRPSPFGIDIEDAPDQLPEILALPHLTVVGLHIYSGTQCLKPEAICENYRIFMSVFRDICEAHDITPQKLVFGSGLGIPYHAGDTPLDLTAVADGIRAELQAFCAEPRFAGTRLILELGRYLIGEAGYFLTSVVGIKESRGQRIVICDGGMNNHLPASGHFGMVIHRNYRMHRVGGGTGEQKVNLVGPLCTSIDRLANAVALPPLAEGDVVAVHCSGAYGLTASPIHFISHAHPREVLIEGQSLTDISRDGSMKLPPAP
ncbi:type III PLP-dependent enzyme [Roseovarius sp. M141]|uniref:type III PLP-dependent enzyme n=1 Tax=Roseovarius sp. M141 TaxID=2583806 RepID=UPI0020CCC445|nr:type III PLP-dependent enzyme [Roseovarius sp. M141]MCQ0090493.1 type III PLP-dependent enzyme [Roseovarius sp. M141]